MCTEAEIDKKVRVHADQEVTSEGQSSACVSFLQSV